MVFNNNSGLEGKMNQKIGWKPILLTLTISIMLFSCNLEDTGQENSSTIQDKIALKKYNFESQTNWQRPWQKYFKNIIRDF